MQRSMIGSGPRPAFEAVLFDIDGVVLDTASVHAAAWQRALESLLDTFRRDPPPGADLGPFEDDDYRRHIDGRPRLEGIATFLSARGLSLPPGDAADPPGLGSVGAVGNLKNDTFHQLLRERGVAVFASTLSLADALAARGVRRGLVSASRNAEQVLEAAGLRHRFDALVDGVVAGDEGLAGKPEPETYLAAAGILDAPVADTAVVEDAIAGVEAGHRGGFGLVVGVDRSGASLWDMVAHGADVVVGDLAELDVAALAGDADGLVRLGPLRSRPWADAAEVVAALDGREVAVLLDFDGTLSPIVADPAKAALLPATRAALARLTERGTVAVVSGRGLDDVRERVGLDALHYLGSHGFELAAPGEPARDHPEAAAYLPALDRAQRRLAEELASVHGVLVERKRYGVSVHYRRVDPQHHDEVRRVVVGVDGDEPELRLTTGKMVLELRPALRWHKGTAVRALLETLGGENGQPVPLYVGDDVTDEDAFEAIGDDGISVVVGEEPRLTRAWTRLDSPDDVAVFLDQLADRLGAAR